MTTLAILAVLTLTIVLAAMVARRRRVERERADIPLFSMSVAAWTARAYPDSSESPAPSAPVTRTSVHNDTPDRGVRFTAAPSIRTRDGAISTLSLPHRAEPPMTTNDDAVGEPVDGQTVRYWRVADGTLQFLPGRLVIAAGRDAGHEIRFVRTAGPDGTLVTFGRAEGAPYRHVQLREPTVSRLHARMELEQRVASSAGTRGMTGGRWRLDNLSSTNPVVVNGKPLESPDASTASVMLSDGDRIEMGEVAFIFHAR